MNINHIYTVNDIYKMTENILNKYIVSFNDHIEDIKSNENCFIYSKVINYAFAF